MYKNDLDIIKTKVFELIKNNNNIFPTKEHGIDLYPYLKNFFNDILQYCDNETIENILITWFKTISQYLDNNKKAYTFCILLILLSYLNNCNLDKSEKKRLSNIIYNILNFLQDFINIKNFI